MSENNNQIIEKAGVKTVGSVLQSNASVTEGDFQEGFCFFLGQEATNWKVLVIPYTQPPTPGFPQETPEVTQTWPQHATAFYFSASTKGWDIVTSSP